MSKPSAKGSEPSTTIPVTTKRVRKHRKHGETLTVTITFEAGLADIIVPKAAKAEQSVAVYLRRLVRQHETGSSDIQTTETIVDIPPKVSNHPFPVVNHPPKVADAPAKSMIEPGSLLSRVRQTTLETPTLLGADMFADAKPVVLVTDDQR